MRRGVTAIESLLSIAIVSIAGAALLSALASAVRTSREIALTTVAQGLADQLLVEVAASPVPPEFVSGKPAGPRSNFQVVDHFQGWSASPPQDRFGRLLGTEGTSPGETASTRPVAMQADLGLLARFRRSITVERVAPSGGGWSTTESTATPFRRVTVRVLFSDDGRDRQLAESSRIVCHVSPSL